MKRLVTSLMALSCTATAAFAADPVSFADKQITMIIGYAPGGGTDASGRLIAQFLAKHLPGKPNLIVRNVPGADGMTSLNYMAQQTKPDGMTITMGSSTQVDPLNYRKPQAAYDPAKFLYVGGVGRGGNVIVLQTAAEKRLHDKSLPPVIMGSVGGIPRSGMQMTAWGIEYLGWNAKWVVGYRGTNDVMIALERGEVEMTATGNLFQINKLVNTGKLKVTVQSGSLENGKMVARPDFGNTPVFLDLIAGKIKDPTAQKAFDYWQSISAMDKWLGLMPGTPPELVAAYREAFVKTAKDPEFLQIGQKISEEFEPMSYQNVVHLIKTLADTPPEALTFMTSLLRKQGLQIAD